MKIEVKDLSYAYDMQPVLNEINFKLEEGYFTGIIGPNGSGKSTLLKCIYRTLTPKSGEILLEGVSIQKIPIKENAKKVAVMSQHNFYNFDFKVKEVVLMGRAPHKKLLERDNFKDYEIIQEALEQVHMEDFAEREFSTLSGGEQQRVMLARALAQKTECLILDEPTNHLDITYQLQLMQILKKQKHTIFASMHDLNIAAMFCDRLFAMKDGKIIAYGTPEEILTTKLIEEVYHVQAEIIKDSKNKLHILFLGT